MMLAHMVSAKQHMIDVTRRLQLALRTLREGERKPAIQRIRDKPESMTDRATGWLLFTP